MTDHTAALRIVTEAVEATFEQRPGYLTLIAQAVRALPALVQPQQPAGWRLVPAEPTPEILAAASLAAWPTASASDIELARRAARIVLMQMDAAPGSTLETIAAAIATMGPAYRAMVNAAAPAHPSQQEDDVRDAKRYRKLCKLHPVSIITAFFGNGCINRTLDDVNAVLDSAGEDGKNG